MCVCKILANPRCAVCKTLLKLYLNSRVQIRKIRTFTNYNCTLRVHKLQLQLGPRVHKCKLHVLLVLMYV